MDRRLGRMEGEPDRNEADHNEQKTYVESRHAQHNPEGDEAERLPNASPVWVASLHSRLQASMCRDS